jgi:hypothetical protein
LARSLHYQIAKEPPAACAFAAQASPILFKHLSMNKVSGQKLRKPAIFLVPTLGVGTQILDAPRPSAAWG